MKEKRLPKLSEKEFEIMALIWNSNEKLTACDILVKVNQLEGNQMERSTVTTHIARMISKGYLEKKRKGRYVTLHPLIPRDEYYKCDCDDYKRRWKLAGIEM